MNKALNHSERQLILLPKSAVAQLSHHMYAHAYEAYVDEFSGSATVASASDYHCPLDDQASE